MIDRLWLIFWHYIWCTGFVVVVVKFYVILLCFVQKRFSGQLWNGKATTPGATQLRCVSDETQCFSNCYSHATVVHLLSDALSWPHCGHLLDGAAIYHCSHPVDSIYRIVGLAMIWNVFTFSVLLSFLVDELELHRAQLLIPCYMYISVVVMEFFSLLMHLY